MFTVTIEPQFETKYIFRNEYEVFEFIMYQSLLFYDDMIKNQEDFLEWIEECVEVEYRSMYLTNDNERMYE